MNRQHPHHPDSTGGGLRARVTGALTAFCLAFVVALSLPPCSASAHARLQSAAPEPGSALAAMPAEITLVFSEPVDTAYSTATLLASTDRAVPLGQIERSDDGKALHLPIAGNTPTPTGTYTLVWRVLSAADGHVTTGTVSFSVGTGVAPAVAGSGGDARPPWWRVLDRWLLMAGLTLLAGWSFLNLLAGTALPIADLRNRRLRWGAWACVAVGLAVSAYDLGISTTGSRFLAPAAFGTYRTVLTDNVVGRALLVVAGLIAALMVIERFAIARRRVGHALQLLVCLSALAALSASGHAAAQTPEWRAVAIDWAHFAAVACWLGALPWLWFAIDAGAREQVADGALESASLLGRFSNAALALMAAIVTTGLLRGYAQIAGPRSLRTSDYGIVLIAKHLLLLPVLIGAAANKLAIVPRLRIAKAARVVAEVRSLSRAARVLIGIEFGAASAILLAAAVLTQLAPADAPLPVDVASRPATIDQRGTAGDLTVWLLARIEGTASDRYTLTINDASGHAPEDLQRVIVQTATAVEGATVGDRFDAEPLAGAPGTFFFPALRIALHGKWELNIIVRRSGIADVAATFAVDTTTIGAQPPRLREDAWRLPRTTVTAWLFGAFSLLLLIGGVIAIRRLRALDPFAATIMLTMLLLIVAGFAVQGLRKTVPVTAGSALANPIASDAGSIQRGGDLYATQCLICHGAGGVGIDNSDPEHLHGSGTNLVDGRTQGQRDGDLYWSITNGVAGTDMPAFDQALSEQERWDLVNYLRSLAATTAISRVTPTT